MAGRDPLFAVKNYYFIGAYNNAINEASDFEGLSESEQLERDSYVYRSYIALGSYDVSSPSLLYVGVFICLSRPEHIPQCMQLVINEIKDSAPMAMQAIKLLASYTGGKVAKVT